MPARAFPLHARALGGDGARRRGAPVSSRNFPTAQDAENAFYEALERCDLDGMMAVWAEDEDIVCIHPTGARLTGQDEVRSGWARIFAGGPGAPAPARPPMGPFRVVVSGDHRVREFH